MVLLAFMFRPKKLDLNLFELDKNARKDVVPINRFCQKICTSNRNVDSRTYQKRNDKADANPARNPPKPIVTVYFHKTTSWKMLRMFGRPEILQQQQV